jgi:hypothetical protein
VAGHSAGSNSFQGSSGALPHLILSLLSPKDAEYGIVTLFSDALGEKVGALRGERKERQKSI